MGFGRKRNDERNYGSKGKARPKLAIAGAIVLSIAILLVMHGTNVRNFDIMLGGGFGVTIGGVLLLFSLSKRNQVRVAKGMKRTADAFKEPCHCCKCTNCNNRYHNHWTHD